MNKPVNILSIDVEEYFQVENFKQVIPAAEWAKYPSKVEENMEKLLGILRQAGVRATFFVLGWIAQRHPALIKKIMQENHEIASHGYAHALVHTQAPEEFRQDIRKTRRILQEITGKPVVGYRAPTFSITSVNVWAFDILAQEGFLYDSSQKGKPPHKINTLWEIPVSTGGGYFRLLPYVYTKRKIESLNKKNLPAVIYLHPWEFDTQQPRIKASALSRFRHYVNIDKNERKLRQLLKDFKFGPMRGFLNQ